MSEDRLARIEQKLDGLAVDLGDLKSSTAEFAVGQATLEYRFERLERDWRRIELAAGDIRGVADEFVRVTSRLARNEDTTRHLSTRIDDHERRIAALETGAGSSA